MLTKYAQRFHIQFESEDAWRSFEPFDEKYKKALESKGAGVGLAITTRSLPPSYNFRVTVPQHVTVQHLREVDVPEGVKVQIKEE
ncbi:hypothetical protein N7467_011421 [Penicillium canescens]|nr:hypothetical protein N7467_011421 [Penicillium canescens]